jgi:hypothetical protein
VNRIGREREDAQTTGGPRAEQVEIGRDTTVSGSRAAGPVEHAARGAIASPPAPTIAGRSGLAAPEVRETGAAPDARDTTRPCAAPSTARA